MLEKRIKLKKRILSIDTRKVIFVSLLLVVTTSIYLAFLSAPISNSDTTTQVNPAIIAAQDAANSHPIGSVASGPNMPSDLLNPTVALSEGVKGVVILGLENGTQTPISTVQGVNETVIFTAKFVSYDKSAPQATLTLNPQDLRWIMGREGSRRRQGKHNQAE